MTRLNNEVSGHALYLYRTASGYGAIRIMDRTVNTVRHGYQSFEEMARYVGVKSIEPLEAALLNNVFAHQIGFSLPQLMIPILGVVAEYQE